MKVAVLVPFQPGDPYRDRNWSWVRSQYEQAGFDVIITGTTDAPGFSRTQAILNARAQSDADLFIVGDADVWCDGLDQLVDAARGGWSIPGKLHRLSDASTWRLLAGEPWRNLPLSTDNQHDSKPYKVHAAGTLLAVTAEAFDTAPPDPRFVGWGQEDDAWSLALKSLVGPRQRVDVNVVHLWHPAEPRKTRGIGNDDNVALLRKYKTARAEGRLRSVIDEARRDVCR